MAPLRVALDKGEFAKEGLDVTLKVLPTPEALPLLAKGEVDALWAAPEPAVMNGIRGGFIISWVAGNFSPDPKPKSGLWVRLKAGETATAVRMAGRKLDTMISKGSRHRLPMSRPWNSTAASTRRGCSTRCGAGSTANPATPSWAANRPASRGGRLYGPRLLNGDVDAGVALLRAYIRTVNTYFAADHRSTRPSSHTRRAPEDGRDDPALDAVAPDGLVADGDPLPLRGGGGPSPVNTPRAGTLSDSGPRPSVAGTGFEPATSGL